ncbi:hypothetical protein CDL12_21022 [Handroanthus impetiginosus]|uniref:Uncharacterized protein n=1 Tax=Handroanthus impetiginosus TaxID=429701 RepID=A0A2G9GMI5_9LAMI|nr:hypothetical protein CDL12_21022 [Handroanthus impetiginosus]
MVFEFNPTSQELCLLNLDSAVAAVVIAKDQEIKELKKRVAEPDAAANNDLCVLAPAKADAAATKEQRDLGAACEEQGDNDGEEKERKDEEEEDEEDEEMDEERKDDEDEEEEEKVKEDEQKEEKTKEGRTIRKVKRNMVEMNKKLEAISRKLNFGQDVNFGERDYEAVRTLSSIIDGVQNRDELIEKRKSKDFDSPLSTTPAKHAKQRNEESDHDEKKKTIPEQEKVGP